MLKRIFSFQGLYGRLDKNFVFQTTVTNVEPTAKQSRVLNPYVRWQRCSLVPSLTGSVVPSYGHRPRTSALARLPRLVCLSRNQRQCRDGAFNNIWLLHSGRDRILPTRCTGRSETQFLGLWPPLLAASYA